MRYYNFGIKELLPRTPLFSKNECDGLIYEFVVCTSGSGGSEKPRKLLGKFHRLASFDVFLWNEFRPCLYSIRTSALYCTTFYRLRVQASQVKSVYMAAVHLRMDRAARQCADFLSAHLDLRSCLEVRALPGVSRRLDVVRSVDAFIRRNMDELLRTLPQNGVLTALDKVKVEVLHASREELEAARARSVAQLVLDWIRAQWMGDERLTMDMLRDKAHMLFLSKDNTLEDCEEIAEGSENDSEIVQDYRRSNQQQHPKQQQHLKKVRRVSNNMRPARPRELLYTRQIDHCDDHSPTNMTSEENNEEDEEWKVISCSALEGGSSILALITIDGHLCTCSIVQRVNNSSNSNGRSVSPTGFSAAASDSNPDSNSGSKSPSLSSRPPSQDKDMFSLITPMAQAKCGAGAVSMGGKLIVCGKMKHIQTLQS